MISDQMLLQVLEVWISEVHGDPHRQGAGGAHAQLAGMGRGGGANSNSGVKSEKAAWLALIEDLRKKCAPVLAPAPALDTCPSSGSAVTAHRRLSHLHSAGVSLKTEQGNAGSLLGDECHFRQCRSSLFSAGCTLVASMTGSCQRWAHAVVPRPVMNDE